MKQKYFLILISILLISLASASFSLSNYSIKTHYAPGSKVQGYLNISFTNEPITNLFIDSLGNSFSLREVLENNSEFSYDCSFENCETEYQESNEQSTKTFSLGAEEEKVVGFVFDGRLQDMGTLDFDLQSNAGESSINQVKIDLLNDGKIDTGNTKVGGELFGQENYGCFNSINGPQEISLASAPFCQRVSLNETPGLMLGAWVREQVSGTNRITMRLYTRSGSFLTACTLDNSQITSAGGEAFCSIDLLIPEKNDYYVCSSLAHGTGQYRTRGYAKAGENCGFFGVPVRTETNAYQIGVRPKRFGAVGTIHINNTLPNKDEISQLISEYIVKTYGGGDCETRNCYVPIKLISSTNQQITLSNIELNYAKQGLPGLQETTLYDLTDTPSNITAPMQKLVIDNFFTLPIQSTNLMYFLVFNTQNLFQEEISFLDFTININPTSAAATFPTEFEAIITPNQTIESYVWDFGDNTTQTTYFPSVNHTYPKRGFYTLTLTAKTSLGEKSRSIIIKVESAEKLITSKINEIEKNIEDINDKFFALSSFEKFELEKIIDLENLTNKLNSIKEMKRVSTTDEEYAILINNLSETRFPKSFFVTSPKKTIFLSDEYTVNFDSLTDITQNTYPDSDYSYDYVLFWNYQNLNVDLLSSELKLIWEDNEESIINVYELVINPKTDITEDYYLLISDSPELGFEDSTNLETVVGYKYLSLDSASTAIKFSTREDVSVKDFVFIAPGYIEEVTTEIGEEEPTNPFLLVFFIFLIAGVIGAVIYFFLHRWYESKYEKTLFPNKNQLYNTIFYINNSVKKGMTNPEIKQKLIKAGWSREQVSYLFKKYTGKNVGMPWLGKKSEKRTTKVPVQKKVPIRKQRPSFFRKGPSNIKRPGHKI